MSKTAHNRKSRKIIIAQRAEAREHFESWPNFEMRRGSKYHGQFLEVFEKEARGQYATMGIAAEMTNIIHME